MSRGVRPMSSNPSKLYKMFYFNSLQIPSACKARSDDCLLNCEIG